MNFEGIVDEKQNVLLHEKAFVANRYYNIETNCRKPRQK